MFVDARVVHAVQHAVGVGERRQRAFAPEGLGEMVLEQVNDPGKRRSDRLLDLLRGQVLARRIDRTQATFRRFGLVVLGKLPPGVDHLDQRTAALEFPVHAQARAGRDLSREVGRAEPREVEATSCVIHQHGLESLATVRDDARSADAPRRCADLTDDEVGDLVLTLLELVTMGQVIDEVRDRRDTQPAERFASLRTDTRYRFDRRSQREVG